MAARKFVSAMGERRRSAFELRGALTTTASSSGSVASQLLARYRRSSLQDDARKQHDVLLQLTKPRRAPQDDEADNTDQGKCSHRSSISTVNEEDESVLAAALAAVALHEEEQASPIAEAETPNETLREDDEDIDEEMLGDLDDVLTAEALDCLMPLPSEAARVFCEVDQCLPRPSEEEAAAPTPVPSVSAPTPVAGPMTLVPRRRKFGTILREQPQQELYLFREEAEYSDYVDARVTGVHAEVDAVVFYELDVHLSQMKWQVLRRFSEFRSLRQRLLAHLARRQRFQSRQCMICADILQTLEQAPFPSRRAARPARWNRLMPGGRRAVSQSPAVIADRKRKLQGFVTTCLLTVRGLRQHSRLMCDSSDCEVSVALRMIEEFLGLSFTRYMRFLNERGVLETDEDGQPLGTGKDQRHTMGRRRVRLPADSDAPRRATMAV